MSLWPTLARAGSCAALSPLLCRPVGHSPAPGGLGGGTRGASDVIFLNFAYLLIVYVTGMDIVYYLSTYSHSLSENERERA